MLHLCQGARAIGFEASGVRATYDGLGQLCLPAIAHLGAGEGHFVTITGWGPRHLRIIDPVSGAVRLPKVDFERMWSGYAVELRPTAPTRLVRHDGGDPEVLCTGASVAADALTGSHTIAVTARDGAITVTLGDLELLTCEPVTLREGLVGVAPLGDGATLTLLTMSVTR